jgi:transposase
MTTIAAEPVRVTGGVDTHSEVHVAAALDGLGRILGTDTFPTTATGYRQMHAWLRSFGTLDRVGVEGTGSYGAALARHLSVAGVEVLEVGRPNRQLRRRHGKTDTVDAIAAARAVLSGEATGTPKTADGPIEALRTLKVVQRSATKARTQALNQISQLLITAPEDIRARLRGLPRRELLAVCSAFRIQADDDTLAGVTRLALRELAHRVSQLDTQLETVKTRLRRITTAVAPELVAKPGIGPDTASTLLVTAGDNPHRLTSERAFAALCGTNPIPASSGKTNRHRLNRGGDRQANSALWRIAIVRLVRPGPSRDYLNKHIAQGKTKTEAIRCLKRHIAREIYGVLPKAAPA